MVAVRASETKFVDDRSTALLPCRVVVVLEEVGRAAVDTAPIAFVYDTPLPSRWISVSARSIDRTTLRVVNQRPQEGGRRNADCDGLCHRGTVVHRAAVAAHVEYDLGRRATEAVTAQLEEHVGTLVGERWPPSGRVHGHVRPPLPQPPLDRRADIRHLGGRGGAPSARPSRRRRRSTTTPCSLPVEPRFRLGSPAASARPPTRE